MFGSVLIAAVIVLSLPIPAQSPVFEQPILITSAGQSADVQLAGVLARKADLLATISKTAGPKDLAGAKTLVLVIGASLKGLGSAGLDTAKEKDRVKALLAEAKSRNIPVLAMHLGGETRRGALTDEMIAAYLPAARLAIVVKSGDKDGIFSRICQAGGIVLKEVDRTLDAVEPLKQAFQK